MNGVVRQVALGLSALVAVALTATYGVRVGDSSDAYFNALTPADYAFVIWALIFLGVVTLAIYQALPSQRNDSQLDTLGWPLVVTYLTTGIWPVAFNGGQIGLSMVLISMTLVGLIAAYLRVTHRPVVLGQPEPRVLRWLVRLPIVVFFGWVTVATIVNVPAWAVSRGVTGVGPSAEAWAATLLLVAAGIGVFIVRRSGDIAYGLVLIWAAWAIVVAHPGVGSTLIAAGLLSVAIAATIGWNLRSRRTAPVQPLT